MLVFVWGWGGGTGNSEDHRCEYPKLTIFLGSTQWKTRL